MWASKYPIYVDNSYKKRGIISSNYDHVFVLQKDISAETALCLGCVQIDENNIPDNLIVENNFWYLEGMYTPTLTCYVPYNYKKQNMVFGGAVIYIPGTNRTCELHDRIMEKWDD